MAKAMATRWAHFRKVWLKPEVYPLIGSMVVAIGVCTTALVNKARDPSVIWEKSKRKGQTEVFDGVDEVVPLWSSSKKNSSRIFASENAIMEAKKTHTELPPPVTVTLAAEEDDDEPEDEEQIEEEPVVAIEQSTASEDEPVASSEDDIVDITDEAADTINAAVDAAIESAANAAATATAVADISEPAASSVAEQNVSPVPTSDLSQSAQS